MTKNKIFESRKEKAVEKLKNGEKLTLRNCSMCYYPLSFSMEDDVLYYDAGCDCIRNHKPGTNLEIRYPNEIDQYLMHDAIAQQWGVK